MTINKARSHKHFRLDMPKIKRRSENITGQH